VITARAKRETELRIFDFLTRLQRQIDTADLDTVHARGRTESRALLYFCQDPLITRGGVGLLAL
jgi:hypothetical protein